MYFPEGVSDSVKQVFINLGIRVLTPMEGFQKTGEFVLLIYRGGYSSKWDLFTIAPVIGEGDTYTPDIIMLHELGHWTGHSSRIGRLHPMSTDSAEYHTEEATAQFFMQMMCEYLNLDAYKAELSVVLYNANYVLADLPLARHRAQEAFTYVVNILNHHQKVETPYSQRAA